MDLNRYKDYRLQYVEAEKLPEECENCNDDCGNCENAGLRWKLGEKDALILERKSKAKAVERLLRDIERIDNRIKEFETE